VKVAGGAALLLDIVVDAADLLRRVAQLGRYRLRGHAVVLGPEHEVELRVMERVIEILLRLVACDWSRLYVSVVASRLRKSSVTPRCRASA